MGFRGTLQDCALGSGLPAIWFPDLPVEGLLSFTGFKRDDWETSFKLSGDRIRNYYSGAVIPLKTVPTGLPVLDLEFKNDSENDDTQSDSEFGFVC